MPAFTVRIGFLVDSLAADQNHLGSTIGKMSDLIGLAISPPSVMHNPRLGCVPDTITIFAVFTPVTIAVPVTAPADSDLDLGIRFGHGYGIAFRLGP